MTGIEKEKIELECPGCKRPMESTYYDVINRREVKCFRCGSSLKIQSMHSSRLSQAIRNLEKAQGEIQKELAEAISKAEQNIKRK